MLVIRDIVMQTILMEDDPFTIDSGVEFRVKALNNEDFLRYSSYAEAKLNGVFVNDRDKYLATKDITEDLNELFGLEYRSDTVDIIGEAFLADKDGDLLSNQEEIVALEGVAFEGIYVIKPDTLHIVVCGFSDYAYDDDLKESKRVMYFMQQERIFKFSSSPEVDPANEAFYRELERLAAESEAIVQSQDFAKKSSFEQYDILTELGREAYSVVSPAFDQNVVTVVTDQYTVVAIGADNQLVFSDPINQESVSVDKQVKPTGKVTGCAYIESLLDPTHTKIVVNVEQSTPSIIIEDAENDIVYLIPIKHFRIISKLIDRVEENK